MITQQNATMGFVNNQEAIHHRWHYVRKLQRWVCLDCGETAIGTDLPCVVCGDRRIDNEIYCLSCMDRIAKSQGECC